MTYCGKDHCKECPRRKECGGCEACKGRPFGGSCVAERNRDFAELKRRLIAEINALGIDRLFIDDLNLLPGAYIDLEYPLDNGSSVRFLNEKDIYLGNQIETEGCERCLGVAANERFILVCEYGCAGSEPELLLYKRR